MKPVSADQPQSLSSVVIRSLVVGLAYAAMSAYTAALLGSMSRLSPSVENILVWWFSGTLVTLALSPLIMHSSWSRFSTVLAAWASMAMVRSLGLGIEGSLFKPTAAASAIAGAAAAIVVQFVVAWLAVWFFMPARQSAAAHKPLRVKRSWFGWVWRIVVVGLAYFVFYFVFGATNALLYTQSFYKNNPQYGLSLPPAGLIFAAQLLRGPLFALGALFLAQAASVSRRQLGLWLGILLFVVGGVGPYVEITFRTMPLGFNLATLTEIFLQNFLTGMVAAALLGLRPAAAAKSLRGQAVPEISPSTPGIS